MSTPKMNMELAALYNTPGGPTQEDMNKTAEAQLFCKLAADNGIDLQQLTDEQVDHLYRATFGKKAEEAPPPAEEKKDEEKKDEGGGSPPPFPPKKEEGSDKEEEKKEAAAREFQKTKEAQAKYAEADYLGRVIAHSFVQELGLIGQSMEKEAKAAPAAPAPAQTNDQEKKASAQEKKASPIDELAARKALEKVAEAKLSVDEAKDKLSALFVLGARESTKIAAAQNFEEALEVRALELLEQVGYPVTWGDATQK